MPCKHCQSAKRRPFWKPLNIYNRKIMYWPIEKYNFFLYFIKVKEWKKTPHIFVFIFPRKASEYICVSVLKYFWVVTSFNLFTLIMVRWRISFTRYDNFFLILLFWKHFFFWARKRYFCYCCPTDLKLWLCHHSFTVKVQVQLSWRTCCVQARKAV